MTPQSTSTPKPKEVKQNGGKLEILKHAKFCRAVPKISLCGIYGISRQEIDHLGSSFPLVSDDSIRESCS